MQTTMLYAGILGVILIVLSVRVVAVVRGKGKVIYGDGGNSTFTPVVRGHANFIEYVPMALILMGLLELNGASDKLLHGLGIALVIARVIHPFGMHPEKPITPARFVGSLGTWLVIAVAALASIRMYF